MAGVRVRQPAIPGEYAVEERGEPPLHRLPDQRLVETRERLGRRVIEGGLDREDALHHRRQKSRRQAFARDVAEHESESSARQVEIVEEISPDGEAWQRGARQLEPFAGVMGLGQERPLDLGADRHLLLEAGFLERVSIEPRVVDRERRFRRERLERRTSLARQQRALVPSVEIEHADLSGLLDLSGMVDDRRRVDVANELERDRQDVADAERDRADVVVLQLAVQQIGDDARLAGRENLLGNLLTGRKREARQRDVVTVPAELELETSCRVGEHDEAALGAGHRDRRVEDQREHLVEHAARSERSQRIEQGGDLVQIAAGGRRCGKRGRPGMVGQEDEIGAAAPADVDAIPVLEQAFRDRFTVDERAAAGPAIPQREPVAAARDLGVVARDVGAAQMEIVAAAPPDLEQILVDRNDPRAERVGDFEPGFHLFSSDSQLTTSVAGAGVGGSISVAPRMRCPSGATS